MAIKSWEELKGSNWRGSVAATQAGVSQSYLQQIRLDTPEASSVLRAHA
jgi:hypothetical protein